MIAGCPKKPKSDPEVLELELSEALDELLNELEDEKFDDLPEDTAVDEN
jgi:hypothetical protein